MTVQLSADLSRPRATAPRGRARAALDRPLVRWGIFAAVWTALALLSVGQGAIAQARYGQPIVWRTLFIGRFADWYTCAVFTPAFVWLARRFPLERQRWRTLVPLYLAVTVVFVPLKYAAYVGL